MIFIESWDDPMRGRNTELAGGIVGRFLSFRREFVRYVLPTRKPPRGLNGQVVHAFGRKEDIGPRLEQAVDAIAGDIHLLLPDASRMTPDTAVSTPHFRETLEGLCSDRRTDGNPHIFVI